MIFPHNILNILADISRNQVNSVSNNSSNCYSNNSYNSHTTTPEPDELGPTNYFANDKHDVSDKWFQFQFIKEGGEWHAYILRMPNFNGRDDNLHITHRIPNGNRRYVCYDPMPTNLPDMIAVTKAWADRELEYITTGVPFEEQD